MAPEDTKTFRWKCTTCSELHEGIPDLAVQAPSPWLEIPEAERSSRGRIESDTCVIDERDYFVRGVIEIPIAQTDHTFGYGVWVSLSSANFERFVALGGSSEVPLDPWFGWLSVRLPGYPDTLLLKTHVHLQPRPLRPTIELEPTDHPLAMEQRVGIRLARVYEIVEHALHGEGELGESTYRHVRCGSHGEAHSTFVCGHIIDGTGSGFWSGDTPGDPWPDAWCDECERRLQAAGEWTDEAMEAANIGVVCHHCYEAHRARRAASR